MPLRLTIARALTALLAAVALASLALAQQTGVPQFRADGPDAEAYGIKDGYPMCAGLAYVGDTRCRVGAFSNYGALFPSRDVRASGRASPLRRAAAEPRITYQHDGKSRTLDDYLDARPVTGLLIARDDTILVERYQYARTDKHLMTSFSMAKTVIGLLVGHAVEKGAIRSIDDTAESYVPGLRGSEYGRTPIKALLRMASGVAFREVYTDTTSDIYTLARLTLEQDPAGSVAALKRFNVRHAPPGGRFSYSSAESLVLGLVVAGATRRTIADFASEVLWRPLGAEADAKWNIDATGQEITFAYFNATLRDWARLGLMLAHGGKWNGQTVAPEKWLAASIAVGPDSPSPIYGYQIWRSYDRSTIYLSGLRGQFVFIDPKARLVLVQTSLASDQFSRAELDALWLAARTQLQ